MFLKFKIFIYNLLFIQSKIWQLPKLENAMVSYFRKINGQNRSSLSEFIFRTEKHAQYKFRNFPLACVRMTLLL